RTRLPGTHAHEVDLVAFDPKRDFTVLPWLAAGSGDSGRTLERPMQRGDVLIGARREETVGSQVILCGQPLTVYGKLGLTGVGPFDRSLFMTFDTATMVAEASRSPGQEPLDYEPGKVSALLVRLGSGARPEEVRFAIASKPGVKVVAGSTLF